MKKILIILVIFASFTSTNLLAQADNSFSYQGELIDAGVPANGTYDFSIEMIDEQSMTVGSASVHSGVTVTNGLFNLNVDFGFPQYDGYENYFFEISIRKTSIGGAYTVLSPLQSLQAVPLASNLVNGAATTGQVLTFNGFQWGPATPSNNGGGTSPWTVNNASLTYQNDVGIGTATTDARLHVKSSDDLTAVFDGGDGMYVWFLENGEGRGYIGSVQSPLGSVLNEDFEIGTTFGSIGNLHIVTGDNNPRLTVDADGLVGIGQTNPIAKLHIDSDGANQDPLRVRVGSNSKFWIKGDGSSNFFGDTKQGLSNNGMMKFMAHVKCSATPSIIKSYNGVANSSGAISVALGSTAGSCKITFPSDIDDRFWQVSAVYASPNSNPGLRGATCRLATASTDTLRCERFNSGTGTLSSGEIMLLIY